MEINSVLYKLLFYYRVPSTQVIYNLHTLSVTSILYLPLYSCNKKIFVHNKLDKLVVYSVRIS